MSIVKTTKVCTGCGRERLLMFFSRNGNRLHSRCVDCHKAQRKGK